MSQLNLCLCLRSLYEFHFEFWIINFILKFLSIYCDNSNIVFMTKNNEHSSRSKYTDFKVISVRKNKIIIKYESTLLTAIDLLTKGVWHIKLKCDLVLLCNFVIELYSSIKLHLWCFPLLEINKIDHLHLVNH